MDFSSLPAPIWNLNSPPHTTTGVAFGLLLLPLSTVASEALQLAPLQIRADIPEHPVVSGETLLQRGDTLGAMLDGEPGIVNQSFGPGVGRPVIRGQGGERVQILENGLGIGDLSALSPDHAVADEPLLAEFIEILRGPATLRYASGALGGVVDIANRRIPDHLPPRPLNLEAAYRFESPADAHTGAAAIDAALGPLAVRLEGLRRHGGDLRTGRGILAHTGADRRFAGAGLSWIGSRGFAGIAVDRLENRYGVSTAEAEPLAIDLAQTRYDFHAAWRTPFPGAQRLELAFGHRDYRHVEIEDGHRGTRWTRRSDTGRVELFHRPAGGWSGSLGFQSRHTDTAALGAEAIVPRTETDAFAGFVMERWAQGAFTAEASLRLERQRIEAEGRRARRDLLVSGGAAFGWRPDGRHHLRLSYLTTERAPQAEERYAFGVHAATQRFEIGDPNLSPERSHQVELSYRFRHRRLEASLTLFQQWVQDYIFFQDRGDRDADSGLPVFTAAQEDAVFRGFEAKIRIPLPAGERNDLDLILFGDLTRGWLRRGGDVPRMPPLRYGAELHLSHDDGELFLRATRAEAQDHPGRLEPPTPAYLRLDLGGEYRLPDLGGRWTVFAHVTNLLDQTIRNSTSFLRTIAPEAGRGVRTGIRMTF